MGKLNYLLLLFCIFQCSSQPKSNSETDHLRIPIKKEVVVGAEQLDALLPKLQSKRVGVVVNHTAQVGKVHLVDTLRALGVNLKKIFAPEHGFRGNADAGEQINDELDTRTGLPIVSLYGETKKPSSEHLNDIDIVVYDIQDVGVRFFTFISTVQLVMEACAEHNKQLIILDRPNPNGDYVDGPILEPEFKSFVGMLPIPIVHGMTVGELATMSNEEGWLENKLTCNLDIVKVKNWDHSQSYSVPLKPSPNLPNDQAIRLYPSLCLFEGTVISLGRGTMMPFQVIGHPDLKNMPYQFTPVSIQGMSKYPPHENKICYGYDLQQVEVKPQLDLSYLIKLYQAFPDKSKFFNNYFEKLSGTKNLREQIKQGLSEEEIRASWQPQLNQYKELRKKYLLYP